MADRWNVARTTATRALKALQAEGLIESTTGSGSVVTRPSAPTAESLISYLRETGSFYPPGYVSTILNATTEPATAQVADALGLEPGESVITRSRIVRDASGTPIEFSTNYIRGEFANLAPALLTPEPIPTGCLGYVESQTGHRATLGADQYAAYPATAEQASALGIRVGDPVLIERHWSTDAAGLVLDYAESIEPGERWRTRRYLINEPSD
jgi:GntR family transcriptional regulator